MKRSIVFLGFVIISSSMFISIIMDNSCEETNSNNSVEVFSDLDYYVSNYLVVLKIDGLDIQAQVNITYNITEGVKYEGFKRFREPTLFGKILKSSIKVYDDEGNETEWTYRKFKGRDGNYYKEIKFNHPGFSGVKTFSINFKMDTWIIEYFGESQIELKNIGTFKIPVKRAEYRVIFPKSYILEKVINYESGNESIEEIDGCDTYIFIQQDSISNDIIITCLPNITDTPPWGSLIPIFIISGLIGAIGIPTIGYGLWWNHLSDVEKTRIRQKREERRARGGGSGGCGGCGGGCGGCGGGCGGCGG